MKSAPRPGLIAPTKEEVDEIVDHCVDRLVEEQPELLSLDVSERALSHQLAVYLRECFPEDLHVDCEYNRHHDGPKRLRLRRRKASDRDITAIPVFPDIVVHRRDTDELNLLVLELKKPEGPLWYDEQKLRAFRKELGYSYAGHLILGLDGMGAVVRQLRWIDS